MRFRIDNIRKIIRQPRVTRNFTTTIFRNAVLDTTRMTRTSFTRESSPLSINSKTQLSTINRDNSANFRKQGILCVKYLRFFSPFFANVAFSKALIPFSKQTYICIYRERERRAFGVEAILSEHSEPSRFVSHESISSETQ